MQRRHRILSLTLLISIVSLLGAAAAQGSTVNCSTSGTITINDGTNTVTGNTSCTGSVTIPSGVTSIGFNAFLFARSLTSITIPSSVTSIGVSAFSNTTSLTSISVDALNANYSSDSPGVLFNKTKTTLLVYPSGNPTTAYTIPSSVTSIDGYAFEMAASLVRVTIPSSITSIGSSAFYNAVGLTSITIPSSVTSIGTWAFAGATKLTTITIPSSVTSIGDYAFWGTTLLARVFYMGNAPTAGPTIYLAANTGLVSYHFAGTTSWPAVGADSWPVGAGENARTTALAGVLATPPAPTAVAGVDYAVITSTRATSGDAPTSYTITTSPGDATCEADASGVCTITGLTTGTAYTFTSVAYRADSLPSDRSDASMPVTPTAPTATTATTTPTVTAPSATPTPLTATTRTTATTISITIIATGRGHVRAVGTTPAAKGTRAKAIRVCSTTKKVKQAGKVTLTCTLTKAARAARHKRALKVLLTTTFTPTTGPVAVSIKTIRLSRR